MANPETASVRAQVRALARYRDDDDPDLVEARRALIAANLTDRVREAIAANPPMTQQMRRRIARLLNDPATLRWDDLTRPDRFRL